MNSMKEINMKKTAHSVTALLLAVVCLCTMTFSAFADGADGTGSIVAADGTTVNGAGESAQETDSIIDANELKSRIDSYITSQGISGNNKVISIGYCYTATGDTWYYDGDQWCYSASLYKVPCCMLLAEKEYNGEITADTQINSQYATGTVDTMERKSIVNSDNYTGHAIVEYLGGTYSGKCAEQTIKFTDLPEDYFPSDFSQYSYYSAKYYTQVLKTLYFNTEKYPRIMDYMKQDQSYHYLDKNLNGQYEVAQKYGAFEEKNGNKNYHSAGIIYTPNPVIVTVMTKNITGFEKHIGAISEILVNYTLELDSQLASFQANKLIAQQQEAARLAQEEQARLEQQALQTDENAISKQNSDTNQSGIWSSDQPSQSTQSSQSSLTTQTAQSSEASIFLDPTPTPASSAGASAVSSILGTVLSLPVLIGIAVLLIIFIIVFAVKLRNSRLEEEMEDEEWNQEDYDKYTEANLEDLAPLQEKKKLSLKERFAKKNETEEDAYDDEYDAPDEDGQDGFRRNIKTAEAGAAALEDDFEEEYEQRYGSRRQSGHSEYDDRNVEPHRYSYVDENEQKEEYDDSEKQEDYRDSVEYQEMDNQAEQEEKLYVNRRYGRVETEPEDESEEAADSAKSEKSVKFGKFGKFNIFNKSKESDEIAENKETQVDQEAGYNQEEQETADRSEKGFGRYFGKGFRRENREARAVEYEDAADADDPVTDVSGEDFDFVIDEKDDEEPAEKSGRFFGGRSSEGRSSRSGYVPKH